jgi:hypothetical protein
MGLKCQANTENKLQGNYFARRENTGFTYLRRKKVMTTKRYLSLLVYRIGKKSSYEAGIRLLRIQPFGMVAFHLVSTSHSLMIALGV